MVTQAAYFCGHVWKFNLYKQRLEEYDVNRWLADAETRIASFNITTDSGQIKEVLVLVSTDHEQAHNSLNGAGFQKMKTFEEFKRECLTLWKSSREADKLTNLSNL